METRITRILTHDVRFPTSRTLDGSDAMNPDPDYSSSYVTVRTDDGLVGHGSAFTIGRGTEVCVAAAEAFRPMLIGRDTEELFADLGGTWGLLTRDSQMRWLGPET